MTEPVARPLAWPDEVDEILAGDLVVAVGCPTPGGGVVLNSVTTLGLRERRAGTVTFTTSLGFGRKLERIAHDPRTAVAYHTRRHGYSDRPGYVLVQGLATIHDDYSPQQREAIREQAARHIGELATGRFWDWWLRVYYHDRVGVEVRARRILWWPSGSLRDPPEVFGEALPAADTDPQPPPRNPTVPRVPVKRVHRSAVMEHRLLGVVQRDGMPLNCRW